MKKSLVALAVLAASGASFAQSSVTLFGGADLNYRSSKAGINKFSGMAQDGIYSSRFGVQGVEDLGGGLKASFHFEGGLNPDTGTPGGLQFQRKSTLGVAGGFGEVRLGRDYTPVFTLHGIADPFGTNGVGSFLNIGGSTITDDVAVPGTFQTTQAAVANTAASNSVLVGTVFADPNAVRANNTVSYYTPNFGGITAALQYGFGNENNTNAKSQGKYTGLNVRYDNGPISAGLGLSTTKGGDSAAAAPTDNQKWKTTLIAGSYNFGVAKVALMNRDDKYTDGTGATGKIRNTLIGLSAPVGAATLKASYDIKKVDGVKAGKQLAIGAVYDLSKRTSVYTTFSKLTNEAGFGNNVGSASASDFTGLASKGFEFGVKHSF